VTDW